MVYVHWLGSLLVMEPLLVLYFDLLGYAHLGVYLVKLYLNSSGFSMCINLLFYLIVTSKFSALVQILSGMTHTLQG